MRTPSMFSFLRIIFSLISLLLGTTAISQPISPPTTTAPAVINGTIIPIQCLGCFALGDLVVTKTDGNSRTAVASDFGAAFSGIKTPIGPFSYGIDTQELSTGIYYVIASDASYKSVAGPITVKAVTTRAGLRWHSIYQANGVCKGPVVPVAGFQLFGGDGRPLRPLASASSTSHIKLPNHNPTPIPIPVVGRTSELGVENIPNATPLVCLGELVPADSYYRNIVDGQLGLAISEVEKRTSSDAIRAFVTDAVRTHVPSIEEERLISEVVRRVMEEIKKGGIK